MIHSALNIPESHKSCRFSTFDWLEGKKLLRDYLDAFTSGKRKGMFFLGKPGVGKTHLLVSSFFDLQEKENFVGTDVLYFDWMGLLAWLRSGFEFKISADVAMSRLCLTKYLLVDDIKPEPQGTFWKQMVELLIEEAYSCNTKLLLSTNADGKEELIERLQLSDYHVSRLGTLVDIINLKGVDRRLTESK